MSISTKLSTDDDLLVISITGKFDFTLLNEFRNSYSNDAARAGKYIVDMRDVSTIDSSALGMLLNMKRYLESPDKEIRIINCNEVVKKVFHVTSFNKKFTIE